MFECLSFSASFTLYYTHTRRQTLSLSLCTTHIHADRLSLSFALYYTHTRRQTLFFTLYYTHTLSLSFCTTHIHADRLSISLSLSLYARAFLPSLPQTRGCDE